MTLLESVYLSLVKRVHKSKLSSAVITGAAGLLGIEHCKALLDLNFEITMVDSNYSLLENAASKLRGLYPNHIISTLNLDITNEGAVADAFANQDAYSCLINNAAVNPSPGVNFSRFADLDLVQWNQELNVGLTGTMLMCKFIGSKMADAGHGSIINIASDLSVIAPDQRIYQHIKSSSGSQYEKPISYSVVKTGLIGLTRYLASYWAEKNVRVNALSPGPVKADQDLELVENLISLIPMRRLASASEYRSAVQFLATEGSNYMTGQNLIIDGGRTCL